MAILARLAFHTPVTLAEVPYEGIEAIQPDDLAYAKELGLSLKLLRRSPSAATAGSASASSPASSTRGHPLAPIEGPFNAVNGRGSGDQRGDDVGARRRGLQSASGLCSATSSRNPRRRRRPVHETPDRAAIVSPTFPPPFYLYLEVADQPGVLARIATVLGDHQVSVKSVVQRGFGDDARLVIGRPRMPGVRFAAAVEALGELDDLRARRAPSTS